MFESISFTDVLKLGLKVMDATAISLCRENNLPILVFNLNTFGNIRRACLGEKIGSHRYRLSCRPGCEPATGRGSRPGAFSMAAAAIDSQLSPAGL